MYPLYFMTLFLIYIMFLSFMFLVCFSSLLDIVIVETKFMYKEEEIKPFKFLNPPKEEEIQPFKISCEDDLFDADFGKSLNF